MAIEWTIESGSAIPPNRLVGEATRIIGLILGVAPESVWSDGQRSEEPLAEFGLAVRATFPDATGTAEVSSDWEVEDDGTVRPYTFAVVEAHRTQVSVAVGVSTAIAVAMLAGGELSGTGLAQRYRDADLERLVDALHRRAQPAADLRQAVHNLVGPLGAGSLPYP